MRYKQIKLVNKLVRLNKKNTTVDKKMSHITESILFGGKKLEIQIIRDNIKFNNIIETIHNVPLFRKFIKVGHMFP